MMNCTSCGATTLIKDARFCEECGASFSNAAPTAAAPGCKGCGAPASAIDASGFCTKCGLESTTPDEHAHWELSVSANLGGVCDLGLKRVRNEDFMALGEAGAVRVAVVCDGVAQSRDAGNASSLAAPLICETLLASARVLPTFEVQPVMFQAFALAQKSVSALATPELDGDDAPASTAIAACIRDSDVLLAWLGDCRAYWFGAENRLLTKDHSWLNEVVESGKLTYEEARKRKGAHAVTRSLGGPPALESPDSGDEPSLLKITLTGPGWLLLCSDGLWGYAPEPHEIGSWVAEEARDTADAATICRGLIERARLRGGRDNLTALLVRIEK